MASGQDCCTPCPTVQTTNIPGTPGATGAAGAAGADGINAFTYTTADFATPACNANVSVLVAENSWMVVGQTLSLPGPAHFEVVALGAGSVTLKFLCYNGDISPAVTIVSGAKVSPSGTQPTLLPEQSFYAVAGAQSLTGSNAQLLSAVVTLPTTGSYLISASVRLDFVTATTLASATVFLKLRETTNGPADVANAVRELATGVVTSASYTFSVSPLPNVVYSGTAGDTIQLQGSISVVPYVGNVKAVEATILALPIE